MLRFVAPLALHALSVTAAAILPRWRVACAPIFEMMLLTALLALAGHVASPAGWFSTSSVVSSVLVYALVRTQKLLIQPAEPASATFRSRWGFDRMAVAHGLHLLPFASFLLLIAPGGDARGWSAFDTLLPLLVGLIALAGRRAALATVVLGGLGCALLALDS